MAADICPAILSTSSLEFNEQMGAVSQFARRVHIDLCDGHFAPTRTIATDEIWWPANIRTDLHVMYDQPFGFTEVLAALRPQLVIVHAEAEGDFEAFARRLHSRGVEVGVAILPVTSPEILAPAIDFIDHVLIFSGDLGHYGGQANLDLLVKVESLRSMKPSLEIGWDGGINDENAQQLIEGGVDVLNVGSFIHEAASPVEAYAKLKILTLE